MTAYLPPSESSPYVPFRVLSLWAEALPQTLVPRPEQGREDIYVVCVSDYAAHDRVLPWTKNASDRVAEQPGSLVVLANAAIGLCEAAIEAYACNGAAYCEPPESFFTNGHPTTATIRTYLMGLDENLARTNAREQQRPDRLVSLCDYFESRRRLHLPFGVKKSTMRRYA